MNSLASKKILVSVCLILALATGVIVQIAGQSTVSVAVCLDLELGRLEVLINGEPFCILLDEAPVGVDGADSLPLTGEVYEGTCHDPGNMIGTFAGTLTFEGGTLEDEFTVVIEFTMTKPGGILHSKSKFTGAIVGEDPGIALQIMESEYAYFESNGVRVNLRFIGLDPEAGTITFVENDVALICLPTFIFGIESPVGGIVMSTDKLAVLTPLMLTGLIAAISTVYVIKRRKKLA